MSNCYPAPARPEAGHERIKAISSKLSSPFSGGAYRKFDAATISAFAASFWYFVAAVTAIGCVCDFFLTGRHFLLETGVTQVIDTLATQGAPSAQAIDCAVGADAFIVALMCVWGALCGAGVRWAFISGLAAYAVDAAVVGLKHEMVSLAFHLYALLYVAQGFAAASRQRQSRFGGRQIPAAPSTRRFGYSSLRRQRSNRLLPPDQDLPTPLEPDPAQPFRRTK